MGSCKKTINLTLDEDLYNQLEKLRKIKKTAFLSSVVIDLTKQALELEEDIYFSKIAKKREKESVLSQGRIWSEKQMWKVVYKQSVQKDLRKIPKEIKALINKDTPAGCLKYLPL